MLEIVFISSESDQFSSAPKEISKFPLMFMTFFFFCRSVYINKYYLRKTYVFFIKNHINGFNLCQEVQYDRISQRQLKIARRRPHYYFRNDNVGKNRLEIPVVFLVKYLPFTLYGV